MPVPNPRENPDQFEALIAEDISAVMAEWGVTTGTVERLDGTQSFEAIELGSTFDYAMTWQFVGVHQGRFLGNAITGNEIRLTGVTMVQDDGGDGLFQRYMDWPSFLRQMGLTLSGEPNVSPQLIQTNDG